MSAVCTNIHVGWLLAGKVR